MIATTQLAIHDLNDIGQRIGLADPAGVPECGLQVFDKILACFGIQLLQRLHKIIEFKPHL